MQSELAVNAELVLQVVETEAFSLLAAANAIEHQANEQTQQKEKIKDVEKFLDTANSRTEFRLNNYRVVPSNFFEHSVFD